MSGEGRLAEKIWKFIVSMPPPVTDDERLANLLPRQHGPTRERRLERTR